MNAKLKGMSGGLRQYGILLALVLIVLLFQFMTNGRLLKPDNVTSLIQQNAYVFILAIGMLMIIVAGHIDLSVGSVVATVGGTIGVLMTDKAWSWPLVIPVALVLGALIGAWQGFWVAYVGVPAFIVTLAGMLMFRGIAQVLVGETKAGFDKGYINISNGGVAGKAGFVGQLDAMTLIIGALMILAFLYTQFRDLRARTKHGLEGESRVMWLVRVVLITLAMLYFTWLLARSAKGFPLVLVIVGLLIIIYSFLMGRTIFGRHVYAIGGNLPAAKLSGVNTRKVNFWLFVNMGLLCGIAAIVVTSRSGSALAAHGQNFELDAIAACFIGGAAVTGGIGRISGAIIGALVMGVLNMGLSIKGVDASWQFVIKGLVLLLAVAFDLLNKRTSGQNT